MSETLVERMARAIAQASGEPWFPESERSRFNNHWRYKALAALRAIREPTERMAMAPYHPDIHDDHMPAEVVWQAMIDAAIAEAEHQSA